MNDTSCAETAPAVLPTAGRLTFTAAFSDIHSVWSVRTRN